MRSKAMPCRASSSTDPSSPGSWPSSSSWPARRPSSSCPCPPIRPSCRPRSASAPAIRAPAPSGGEEGHLRHRAAAHGGGQSYLLLVHLPLQRHGADHPDLHQRHGPGHRSPRTRVASARWRRSPQRLGAKGLECGIASDQWESLQLALCSEHPVERIAMHIRIASCPERMQIGDG